VSQFSENLRSHINASGMTIYKLAKETGLERTLVHKVLNDDRVPSDEFVGTIADALFLSPIERAELYKSFEIRKIGEFRYNQRAQVKQMVELIAKAENDNRAFENGNGAHASPPESLPDAPVGDPVQLFYGYYAINDAVKNLIEAESLKGSASKIDYFIPAKFKYFYDVLSICYMKNPTLNIRHIIPLAKKAQQQEHRNNNLTTLFSIIRLAFTSGTGYAPYYFYSDEQHICLTAAMPYFLITSSHLLTLNADLDVAVLYRDRDMIDYYANFFNEMVAQTHPLLKLVDNFADILSYHLTIDRKEIIGTSCLIESQPCIGHYVTEQLVERKLRRELDNRDQVKALALKHFEYLRKTPIADISLFSVAGMDYMFETGYASNIPTSMMIPLTHDEIRSLISQYLDDVKSGRFASFAIDPAKFTIPLFTTVFLDKLTGVHFLTYRDADLRAIHINEPSIVEAFEDFCTYFEKSDLVYSQEETIRILEGYVNR